jgi:membrane protease YdiL (CAAX protease family)
LVTAATTGLVTLAARFVPERFAATSVGFVFLLATWLFVWRRDDATVEASGLALGGLVLPGPLPVRRMAKSFVLSVGWALLAGLVVFVPFALGWRRVWHVSSVFRFPFTPAAFANEAFGQLVIIALPEEAFYRGYLQSRLDVALGPRLRARLFGADVGLSIVLTSALFALGHVATIPSPARLAVFFPSLLFGLLRARTRGIGAGIVFHAMCNLLSEILGKGYGLY